MSEIEAWVHPNRHLVKKGDPDCLSVKIRKPQVEPIFYMSRVLMRNCILKVNQSGVRTYQQKGVRTVHSWVVGEISNLPSCFVPNDSLKKLDYLPSLGYFFDVESGERMVDMAVDPERRYPLIIAIGKDFYYKETQ